MIYTFSCSRCGKHVPVEASIKSGPPDPFPHGDSCDGIYSRVWTMPQFICRGDPDEIPHEHQTVDVGGGAVTHEQVVGPSKAAARRKEKAYQSYLDERRKIFKDNKQVGGRMTHQVPTELYHAKIKQTGDKDYWADSTNVNRHKSCKVS